MTEYQEAVEDLMWCGLFRWRKGTHDICIGSLISVSSLPEFCLNKTDPIHCSQISQRNQICRTILTLKLRNILVNVTGISAEPMLVLFNGIILLVGAKSVLDIIRASKNSSCPCNQHSCLSSICGKGFCFQKGKTVEMI